ncbi:MAG TPA: COX15/CtaA family protein [Pseudonocardiaceae bacterium]|nr:COX15/CtaA family protein [Pseudonocardiaceae bacterium]
MPIAPRTTQLIARVPAPNRATQRAIAIANLVVQIGIMVSGSVVRVTGSGLGCPTWPTCTASSLVPVADPTNGQLHQWVEFSNRMFGIAVGVISVLVFLMAVVDKPMRRRYVLLTLTMPLGFVAQAVMGGLTVLLKLVWWSVCLHFLLSPVLVWLAVLIVHAVTEGDGPARPLLPKPLRGLLAAMALVLTGLVMAGTLVTAAGPHAGDIHTPRLDLPIPALVELHADFLFVFLGMLAALFFAMRITGGTKRLWRRYWILTGLILAQGALGITQYELGVPDALVSFHVLGSALCVTAMAFLWAASRERDALPATPAEPLASGNPATAATAS